MAAHGLFYAESPAGIDLKGLCEPRKKEGKAVDASESSEVEYYCLQCLFGKEEALASGLERAYPGLLALAAAQEKHHSERGQKSLVRQPLFQGYLFLKNDKPLPYHLLLNESAVLRVLGYDGALSPLKGLDRDLASWIFEWKGLLSCSTAQGKGKELQFLSGPLTNPPGHIRKIDRHNRNACLSPVFDGAERPLWLPFKWADALSPKQQGGFD